MWSTAAWGRHDTSRDTGLPVTVKRGQDWGEPGVLSTDAPCFSGDSEAALHAMARLAPGGILTLRGREVAPPTVEIGILSGDLHRSLGSPLHTESQLRAGAGTRFPADLALVKGVRPDGSEFADAFLAHLVAMERRRVRSLFSARTVVVMNSTHRGGDDLGPRAHPNDGLLDVTDGQLFGSDRLRARKRMRTGSHLPHPMLATSRGAEFELRFSRPAALELDGRARGQVVALHVQCLPDAIVVVA